MIFRPCKDETDEHYHQRCERVYWRASIVVTAIAAFGAGFSALYAFRIFQETKIQIRPNIVFKGLDFSPFDKSKNTTFNVIWENSGSYATKNLKLYTTCSGSGDFPRLPKQGRWDTSTSWTMGAKVEFSFDGCNTGKDKDHIVKLKEPLQLFGQAIYEDESKEQRITRYCVSVYDFSLGKNEQISASFAPCSNPHYTCQDEECNDGNHIVPEGIPH